MHARARLHPGKRGATLVSMVSLLCLALLAVAAAGHSLTCPLRAPLPVTVRRRFVAATMLNDGRFPGVRTFDPPVYVGAARLPKAIAAPLSASFRTTYSGGVFEPADVCRRG